MAHGDPKTEQNDSGLWTQTPSSPGATIQADDVDRLIIGELVKVLMAHPAGLRRWSVMQAIRADRNRGSRPISLRFESEIERVFRRFCAEGTENRAQEGSIFLFYRPEGRAGEVWAVRPDKAKASFGGATDSGRRGFFQMTGTRS
jgi:hypothetical protein